MATLLIAWSFASLLFLPFILLAWIVERPADKMDAWRDHRYSTRKD